MEQVTRRKQIVLDALDSQIEELEDKLRKAQPMIDELNQLKRTRATLLDERRPTGGGGRTNAMLSMETMILDMRTNGPSTPQEIADRLGVNVTVVRSHLNRYRDQRYAANGDGKWRLIGENTEEEDDGEE
jgi:acetylornithine deacetylase/succinyl-diaminopimelate desuccinylase-like protein